MADDEEKSAALIQRAQWLRAAILGANDGLLSTTALMLGVGAAKDDHAAMIVSGLAGALAGACSMAVGEFVSVSTQRDIQQLTKDNAVKDDDCEKVEPRETVVSDILKQNSPYVFPSPRSPFMKVMAIDTHTRESVVSPERSLLVTDIAPNPYKAAGASGLAFLCGSIVPLLSAVAFSEKEIRVVGMVVVVSVALAVFGGVGASLGGSPVSISAMRVLLGGWIAMAVTYGLLKPLDRDDHKEPK